jgi:hypothetical protein
MSLIVSFDPSTHYSRVWLKVLDADDITNGLFTVTPGSSDQCRASLTVMEGEMAYSTHANANGNDLNGTPSADQCALSTTSASQRAFGWLSTTNTGSSRVITMTEPNTSVSNVTGSGAVNISMAVGIFDYEAASHDVSCTVSASTNRYVYGHVILDPVTPPTRSQPWARVKRSVSAGAFATGRG